MGRIKLRATEEARMTPRCRTEYSAKLVAFEIKRCWELESKEDHFL